MANEPLLQKRSIILYAFFALWLLIAGVRTWQIAIFQRQKFLSAGEDVARFIGNIPPQRGKILDINNTPLAWNERYYDLITALEPGETFTDFEKEEISRRFPDADWNSGKLKIGLSPAEVVELEKLISGGVRIKIIPRIERIMVNSPKLRPKLQALDKLHDETLRGEPGKFQVLLDHYHQWIPSTWELLSPPIPGIDLKLKSSLSKLEREP